MGASSRSAIDAAQVSDLPASCKQAPNVAEIAGTKDTEGHASPYRATQACFLRHRILQHSLHRMPMPTPKPRPF